MSKKIAIYAGSFDPFTNGHLDMVVKASRLFDEVHILIAVNSNKKKMFDSKTMKDAIDYTLFEYGISNCKVIVFNGLVANYAKKHNVGYMVRGLRNNLDYNYEENIAEVNKLINPKLEYIYFRAVSPAISSSMVKELCENGHDISNFVPPCVKQVIDRKE